MTTAAKIFISHSSSDDDSPAQGRQRRRVGAPGYGAMISSPGKYARWRVASRVSSTSPPTAAWAPT